MQNWVLVLFGIVALSAVSSGKFCSGPDDCKDGECCVALSLLQLRNKGICFKNGKKGAFCSETESAYEYFGGKYVLFCPCAEGLQCAPRKNIDRSNLGKYLADLRCQTETVTSRPETTAPPEIVEETTVPEEIPETTVPEEIVEETTVPEEIVELTTVPEEIVEETTVPEEIVELTTIPEEIVEETTVPEEIVEETEAPDDGEEIRPDEDDNNEFPGDDEVPDEEEGPGGEPPRDDDCENWEYPC